MSDSRTIGMSAGARAILDSFQNGFALCVPRVSGRPKLVQRNWARERNPEPDRAVDRKDVAELLASGLVGELTEHRNNQKIGWRESGLPGKSHRVYLCVQ